MDVWMYEWMNGQIDFLSISGMLYVWMDGQVYGGWKD